MIKQQKNIILGVDTGIGGGSLSLWIDGEEVDGWIGSASVSRSEDILSAIDELLLINRIKKNRIDFIISNENPGSFTGIRIGSAILKALKNVLPSKFKSIPVLEAMLFQLAFRTETLAAVPIGRSMVAWLVSDSCGTTAFYQKKLPDFVDFIKEKRFKQMIIQDDLIKYFLNYEQSFVINAGVNLSAFLVKFINASDNE